MRDIKVKKLSVGLMQTNCYIVFTKGQCIIVDPGDDADFITKTIKELEVEPVLVAATHGHFDHTTAALELKLNFKIPFAVSLHDEFLLKRQRQTIKYFQSLDALPSPKVDLDLSKETTLNLNEVKFKIIKTPGHTPGSISLFNKRCKILLSGDLIFKDGLGRYDFSYADRNHLKNSVEKIAKLPSSTTVYPGHGEVFELGQVKSNLDEYLSLL